MKSRIDLILKNWCDWYANAERDYGVQSPNFNRLSGSLNKGTAFERKMDYFSKITHILNGLSQKEKQFFNTHFFIKSDIEYKIRYLKTNKTAYYRQINAIKAKIAERLGVKNG